MKNGEISGVWLRTKNVFDNGEDRRTVIGELKLYNGDRLTMRGYANEPDIIDGVTYRFFGYIKNHPRYGNQFQFSSFVEEKPVDEESIIAYLHKTCGKPTHGSISPRIATELYRLYGAAAIDRVIEDPIGVAQYIKQWGADKASVASHVLAAQSGTQRCKMDLISLVNGRKFPARTMDRAIKKWGAKSAEMIRENPYILMDLPGIGFLGADKLYCDLSRETSKTPEEHIANLASIHRQGLCVCHAIEKESRSNGSTWVTMSFARNAVITMISSVHAKPDNAINWAVLEGYLVTHEGFIASSRKSLHELEIAEFVCGSADGSEWPSG